LIKGQGTLSAAASVPPALLVLVAVRLAAGVRPEVRSGLGHHEVRGAYQRHRKRDDAYNLPHSWFSYVSDEPPPHINTRVRIPTRCTRMPLLRRAHIADRRSLRDRNVPTSLATFM
jgi:hypothetical protein